MRRPSLIIFLLLIVLVVVGTWLVGAMLAAALEGPIAEPVSWTNGDVELEGSLYWPEGDAPHAAAVFIPGWGDWTRDEQLFREHAERMAERGIALLIYDKRGCGESTGDWRRASLADLAEDALGGVRVLREQSWVDPERIGLFGTSQGGAIAVIAASRSADVSFVATLSMSTRSPAEHDNFIVGAKLRKKGYGEEEITRAVGLHRDILKIHRMGRGWGELAEEVEAARGERWFTDGGIEFPPKESGKWATYRDLPMDFDVRPLLVGLQVPLFAAQGEADWLVPGPRAVDALRGIAAERSKDFTVVSIPDAEHTLRVRNGWPGTGWTWPEAYWDALDDWLDEVTRRRD